MPVETFHSALYVPVMQMERLEEMSGGDGHHLFDTPKGVPACWQADLAGLSGVMLWPACSQPDGTFAMVLRPAGSMLAP